MNSVVWVEGRVSQWDWEKVTEHVKDHIIVGHRIFWRTSLNLTFNQGK